MPVEPTWSPTNSLCQRFFSGDYDGLVRETLSGKASTSTPAAIGALAMVGRLEEALMAAENAAELERGLDEVMTARFFLCMGFCHAGRYGEASRMAAAILVGGRRGSPYCKFLGWQASALVHYFQGRMRHAERSVKRALARGLASSVPYARLIALDLYGHVLAQSGQLHRGIRALRDAETLAQELGFEANATTSRTSALVYALRLENRGRKAAAAELTSLVESDIVSRFAKRNALIHLAFVAALEGRAKEAAAILDKGRDLCLESDDRRGLARLDVVDSAIAIIRGEQPEKTVADESNLGLSIELAYVDALLNRPFDVAQMRQLWATTSVDRCRIALVLAGALESTIALDWPAIARLSEPQSAIERVVTSDALGLLPFVRGTRPGRRIYVCEASWILECVGDLEVVEMKSERADALLAALAERPLSKPELMSRIWGIRAYNATLHDATVYKLVSRVRKILGERADWLLHVEDGYALANGVEVIDCRGLEPQTMAPQPARASLPNRADQLLGAAANLKTFSCAELADRLSVSQATALRLLKPMIESGAIKRAGVGKNTRYHLNDQGQ